MPVRNGNFVTDRTAKKKAPSEKWVARVVTRADRRRRVELEELDRETGEKQTTVGTTRRKGGG